MSRGRTAATAVALIVIISLLGACGSGSSKSSPAENDRRSVALNKKAAAQKRTLAVKRKAAAARRHAKRIAKLRNRRHIITTQAHISAANDAAAIQRTVDALNAAFRAGVAAGITNSEVANHWVRPGVYTGDQCSAFETARGQGIVSEMLVVHPESLAPAPGWVDPVIGRVPNGRIYRMAITEIQTLVPTGQQRARTLPIHVTVKADGVAHLFFRCA